MDSGDKIHNMPVPERFIPLITATLAEAYAAEAATGSSRAFTPQIAPNGGGASVEWTKEEVTRAYRESTPALRAAFDYLADHPKDKVSTLELARAVYPDESDDVDAKNKLYGVLGGFGKRAYSYGKAKWFFLAERPDPNGYMVYTMPADEAAWLREASGRE